MIILAEWECKSVSKTSSKSPRQSALVVLPQPKTRNFYQFKSLNLGNERIMLLDVLH
jgi:hypothetical protein